MTKIFISYRREDSEYQTDRLFRALTEYTDLPNDSIFIDIDNIPLGVDFVTHIEDQVSNCDVLLAVIGERWLKAQDPKSGTSRLHDPTDFVRLEIAAALEREIPVVPVLLDNVDMPSVDELPENMKLLARRNGVELNRKTFERDVERLVSGLPISSTAELDSADNSGRVESENTDDDFDPSDPDIATLRTKKPKRQEGIWPSIVTVATVTVFVVLFAAFFSNRNIDDEDSEYASSDSIEFTERTERETTASVTAESLDPTRKTGEKTSSGSTAGHVRTTLKELRDDFVRRVRLEVADVKKYEQSPKSRKYIDLITSVWSQKTGDALPGRYKCAFQFQSKGKIYEPTYFQCEIAVTPTGYSFKKLNGTELLIGSLFFNRQTGWEFEGTLDFGGGLTRLAAGPLVDVSDGSMAIVYSRETPKDSIGVLQLWSK